MSIRILIADDHAIVRRGIIQILLETYPFSIMGEVADAEELLQKVVTEKWDVVICDINMPGRSGLEALEQIKQAVPGLPVIIMSMYPEDQYALRAFRAGASGYLGKETIHVNLVKAIERVLNGKKFITPSVAEILANSINGNDEKLVHTNLSNREFEIFILLATGKTTSAIAEKLSINVTTVSTYRSRIMGKMNMRSNSELTRYALESKLI